jgi:hypothetical protein
VVLFIFDSRFSTKKLLQLKDFFNSEFYLVRGYGTVFTTHGSLHAIFTISTVCRLKSYVALKYSTRSEDSSKFINFLPRFISVRKSQIHIRAPFLPMSTLCLDKPKRNALRSLGFFCELVNSAHRNEYMHNNKHTPISHTSCQIEQLVISATTLYPFPVYSITLASACSKCTCSQQAQRCVHS